MTGCSTDIYPPYPNDLDVDCVEARRELVRRFEGFQLRRKIGMTDTDAGELMRWLSGPDFGFTCELADVPSGLMRTIFERQIQLGFSYQANFALN